MANSELMNWNTDVIQNKFANTALDDIIVNTINSIWSNEKGPNVNSIFDYPKESNERNDVDSGIIETWLINFTITGRLEVKHALLNYTNMTKKKKKQLSGGA